jgi:uncharacterized protein YggE
MEAIMAGAARFVVRFACFCSVALAFAAPARAQEPPPVPPARIIVSGEGVVRAAPDYAHITVGVTTNGATASAASEANSRIMAAVATALRGAGIAPPDLQTAHFSVQPVYASATSSSAPKLSGFSVTNQFGVTVRQVERVGDVLDRAIAAGANDVGSIQFQHADLSKTLDLARTAALADARRKAELYAHAAELTLGAVSWVIEEQANVPQPRFLGARMAASAPVPIAAGEDTLQVRVTVGFDVAH